jgi:hypothetical protein
MFNKSSKLELFLVFSVFIFIARLFFDGKNSLYSSSITLVKNIVAASLPIGMSLAPGTYVINVWIDGKVSKTVKLIKVNEEKLNAKKSGILINIRLFFKLKFVVNLKNNCPYPYILQVIICIFLVALNGLNILNIHSSVSRIYPMRYLTT